eukprot:jgi/Botrbrau1/7517/Bobra.0019s0008.1
MALAVQIPFLGAPVHRQQSEDGMDPTVEPQLKDNVRVDILADGSGRGLAHVHEAVAAVVEDPVAKDPDVSRSSTSTTRAEDGEHVVVEIRVERPGKPKSRYQMLLEEDFYTLPAGLRLKIYFRKMRGGLDRPLPVPSRLDLLWSWMGSFLGILLIAGLHEWLRPRYAIDTLVPSFGASAVLIFGVPDSKLAQPRNLIGGHLISAVIGCTVRLILFKTIWLSGALAMSLALFAMQMTKTTHPPGGATALIAAIAVPKLPWAGFEFVIGILIGCISMLLVALIVNNWHRTVRYPTFWW